MFIELKGLLELTVGELEAQEHELWVELVEELSGREQPYDDDSILGELPLVRVLIEEARLGAVLNLAGISGAARTTLEALGSVEAIDDAVLAGLVGTGPGKISGAEASAVGKTIERYFVCEDSKDLVDALDAIHSGANFGLATRSPAAWQTALASFGDKIPPGTSIAAVSEVLARRFEILYPVIATFGRIPPVIEAWQKGALDALIVTEANNPRRFDGAFSDLNLDGISPGGWPTLESHWTVLRTMVRGYPGLGFAELFDDYTRTTGQRYDEMNARVNAWIAALSNAAGPSFRADPLALDLREGSPDWSRFSLGSHAAEIRANTRAHQRMRAIGGDVDTVAVLLAAGHSSATAVSRARLDAIQALPGLSGGRGEQVWNNARHLATDAALFVTGVADVVGGAFDPAPTRPPPSVGQGLASLEGFASLFGNQSYCDCDHCASILGPAAYFVDLMYFVKQEVGDAVADDDEQSLRSRRPDLWTFPLTCDATTALVPTLGIVNEVLENAIATAADEDIDVGDRVAVENLVYASNDGLPGAVRSFVQPFAAGSAHVSALFDAFDVDRAALTTAMRAAEPPPAPEHRRVLGVSTAMEQAITVARTTLSSLGDVYGFPWTNASDVDPFDAELLAPAMGLDREGLGAVVTSWFVRQGGPTPNFEMVKRDSESVQADQELVVGLTVGVLDRMHRLTRASRALSLSVAQLDRLLNVLGDDELASLEAFAQLRTLASRVGAAIPDDDAAVLAGPLDAVGMARFNRGARGAAQTWPTDPLTKFFHPGLVTDVESGARALSARLASALGLKDAALLELIRFLAPQLAQGSSGGFDPAAVDPTQRYFALSVANLTLLDRHARLARLLGVSIDDLARLMALRGIGAVTGLASAIQVAEARNAWRTSGRTLDQLAAATGGQPRRTDVLLTVASVAAAIRRNYAAARAVSDDLLVSTCGVSAADSRAVLADNASLFTTTDGVRVISDTVDVSSAVITVAPGVPAVVDGVSRPLTSDDIIAALLPHSAHAQLEQGLATASGRDEGEMAKVLVLAGVTANATLAASIRAATSGTALETAIAAASRVDVATRGWTAAALDALRTVPERFGPGSWPTINVVVPERPTFTFTQATALGRAAVRGTAPDRQDVLLHAVLHFTGTPSVFTAEADASVAALLGTSVTTIASLRGRVTLVAGAIAALDQLAVLVRVADRLGVDGDVLDGLVSDTDAERKVAAIAVEHAAALRGERNAAEAKRLADAQNQLRESKRDALLDFLLRSPDPIATNRLDLSAHFLIDVDAGGCSTTSRVVSATNAVQEYVTRITLGLEHDDADVRIALSAAGTRSWEWRRAYRVWEANRKVFLWPENYLEPGVRDDKTPLFSDLEDTLAQGDLDESSILSAYATYIHGLEELASLRVAGAYHEVGVGDGADTDVLHVVGVTPTDPATFFYRSVTDLAANLLPRGKSVRWGHWQKLDLSTSTRFVSPVVHEGRLSLLWPTIKTRAKQQLASGGMDMQGYLHTYGLSAVSMNANGTWGRVQALGLPYVENGWFPEGPGMLWDALDPSDHPAFATDSLPHGEPIDGYTLSGVNWQRVVPVRRNGLKVVTRNYRFIGDLDLYLGRVVDDRMNAIWSQPMLLQQSASGLDLVTRRPHATTRQHPEVLASAGATVESRAMCARETPDLVADAFAGIATQTIASANVRGDILPVLGQPSWAFATYVDPLLFVPAADDGAHYVMRRVGSSVVRGLGRKLFEEGIDGVVATAHQFALNEASTGLSLTSGVIDGTHVGKLDFVGPLGTYLRELFLHIPILIATSLAARGRHADARRWFHRVFDPTSSEVIDTTGAPPDDVAHRQLLRVWRYREFREQVVEGAASTLSDGAALAAYMDDPFNPHAIARCRLTAYQRHTFGRYIDNLLDWADLLFAQFQRETVEEARALYQLAARLLGARPTRLGDCELGDLEVRDYEHIESLLTSAEPPRIGAETEVMARRRTIPTAPHSFGAPTMATIPRLTRARAVSWIKPLTSSKPVAFDRRWVAGRTSSWAPSKSLGVVDGSRGLGGDQGAQIGAPARGATDDTLAASVLSQLGPVFCVPVNKTLLARWDRVEDRLWKLHHCLDLDGVRRDLSLFAPELDPMSRVEATALGLTPDELVSDAASEVPPYRFSYLIERAKGFASSLSGFGGALLGALERRDNEALSVLRQEQGLAMARMTRQQRELDVEMAQQGLAALERQIASAEYRRDYHDNLLTTGLSIGEASSLGLQGQAAMFRAVSAKQYAVSAVAHSLPEVNAPWSVSTGGEHTGNASDGTANFLQTITSILESGSSLSGTIAGYERRADGWSHQLQLIRDELASMANQRRAAVLRVTVAEQALVAYDESIKQLEDALQFERERVTNLALHTRLASGLKQLYRMAYGHALALARLAERAYHYERGETGGGLSSGYWDASIGGLLAGERLLSDLQALDRRFLESNHRELEIEQPFPLSQLDPQALVVLRETGTCTFSVPEIAFDLAYPGHYRRRLRAVRLTIPCVTGPYVNVSATLKLESSQVRATPNAALLDVPLAHGTTVAASSAQADGGVFELSFRDERYLPFEGQGAVSTWTLTLPRSVRAFDYGSISDVLLSLAYSARPDDVRRDTLDPEVGDGSLIEYHEEHATQRMVSARQDLGASLTRLLRSAAGTPVAFTLTESMLPPVYRGRDVAVVSAASAEPLLSGVSLRLAAGVETPGAFALAVDGVAVSGFVANSTLGGLYFSTEVDWAGELSWSGEHTISITHVGALGTDGVVDPDKLVDVMLWIPVRLA